eukprot:2167401-Rhodomonas_salina.6
MVLSPYALATRCPTYDAICLRTGYAMSGTDLVSGATRFTVAQVVESTRVLASPLSSYARATRCLLPCYALAMSGTDIGYAATTGQLCHQHHHGTLSLSAYAFAINRVYSASINYAMSSTELAIQHSAMCGTQLAYAPTQCLVLS